MKYSYFLLILLLVYVLFEALLFYYKFNKRPVLVEFVHLEKTLGSYGPNLRYIAAGDSTAVGMGASDVSKTYPNNVAEEFSKNNTVIYKNIGVVGAKTQDVLDKQVQQIIDFKPSVVTISIGGNDATHMLSAKKVAGNYKKIVEEILEKTEAIIYITTVPNFGWAEILPWFYRDLIEYRYAKVNEEIVALESNRVRVVNIHDFGWSQFPDKTATNAGDDFHPNDLGYQNWTDAFLDRIKNK